MKEFSFTGNWSPKVQVSVLSQLGNELMFRPNHHLKWIRELYQNHQNNLIQCHIHAAKNENDVPETYQLEAINFLLNNEDLIIESIYDNLKSIVYPYYNELFDVNLETDIPLEDSKDLKASLGLIDVEMNLAETNGLGWTTYNFEWKGEDEHGLSMLFCGAKFLKHEPAGNMWFGGLVSEKLEKEIDIRYNLSVPLKQYYPNSELNSYKPWQLEKTKDYLISLLKNNKFGEFKKLFLKEILMWTKYCMVIP